MKKVISLLSLSLIMFQLSAMRYAQSREMVIINRLTLLSAAKNNDTALICRMLNQGVFVNTINRKLQTPLHLVLSNPNPLNPEKTIQNISLLIAKGANINAQDARGWTPLHHAVMDDNEQAITTLLKYKEIKVNIRDKCGRTPLFFSCSDNITGWLILRGANPFIKDFYERTFIDYMIMCRYFQTEEELMQFMLWIESLKNPPHRELVHLPPII